VLAVPTVPLDSEQVMDKQSNVDQKKITPRGSAAHASTEVFVLEKCRYSKKNREKRSWQFVYTMLITLDLFKMLAENFLKAIALAGRVVYVNRKKYLLKQYNIQMSAFG
jgi:hypothetical protein